MLRHAGELRDCTWLILPEEFETDHFMAALAHGDAARAIFLSNDRDMLPWLRLSGVKVCRMTNGLRGYIAELQTTEADVADGYREASETATSANDQLEEPLATARTTCKQAHSARETARAAAVAAVAAVKELTPQDDAVRYWTCVLHLA